MLRKSFVSSTPRQANKRKSVTLNLASPNCSKRLGEDSTLLNVNEDEEEKKAHRRSIVLNSFQKTPSALCSPHLTHKPQSQTRFNPDQLKQHYADCIKLSTENKINAKNAFGLHLLEYIDTILQEKSDNFQVVGCTIDAGAKIYAGRVDAVHGDILKMLGSIGTSETNNAKDEDVDDGDDADNNKKKKDKKKKKITLSEGRTIETNLANIRNTTYDLSFDVDPLIQITARQSDEQTSSAMILYNVEMRDDTLRFDSTLEYHNSNAGEAEPDVPTVDVSSLESLIPSLLHTDNVICPSFEGFRFNGWRCDEDKSFYVPMSQADVSSQESDKQDPEPFVPGMDNLDDEDVVDDFRGVEDSDEEAVMSGAQNSHKAPQTMTIEDLTLALQPTEFGYFNPRLLNMWAGPGHWKLKAPVKVPSVEERKKKKKAMVMHTFDSERDDLMKHFIKSRARTTLKDETIRSNKAVDNVLPVDIHYQETDLRRLSLIPLWRGKLEQSAIIRSQQSENGEWYNYDNPHDVSNYCPNVSESDDEGPGDGGDPEVTFENDPTSTPIGGLELIDAAPKIEKINIQYAKKAKKIDVKRLKEVMWKNINRNKLKDTENLPENQTSELIEDLTQNIRFSDIYKKIPSQVSGTMADNLSVPIAFACLLHLANEHSLKLEDNPRLSDIRISTTGYNSKAGSP